MKEDEIGNNFQFEIIFSNKKITIKGSMIKSERIRKWRVEIFEGPHSNQGGGEK